MHFFHSSDTCYLGSNASTKFLESIDVFDSFWKATLTVVLECYGININVAFVLGITFGFVLRFYRTMHSK
jgi:hypothetical protein